MSDSDWYWCLGIAAAFVIITLIWLYRDANDDE